MLAPKTRTLLTGPPSLTRACPNPPLDSPRKPCLNADAPPLHPTRSPMKAIASLLSLVLLPVALLAADDPKEIPLWANGAPGSEGKTAPEVVKTLVQAYKILFREGLTISNALVKIEAGLVKSPELDHLVAFIRGSERGISK